MITKRQYKILQYFLTRSLFFGLGISSITNLAKNDSWLAGILGLFIGLGIVSLLYFFKKNPKFNQALKSKCFGRITNLFILLFACFCMHDVIISLVTMATSFLLPLTPPIVIALSVIITVIYANAKGINTIARVAEILVPISVVIFLIKVLSSLAISDYSNFFPMFYGHKLGILSASLIFGSFSALPSFLLLNIDCDLSYKDSVIGYILGSLSICLTLFSINGVLGPTLSTILRYPEYMALKKIRIFGFIDNIENILTFTWLFDLIILGFLSAYNIKKIVKQNIESKQITNIFYYVILAAIIYIAIYIFNVYYYNTLLLYKYEPFILYGFIIILFISLFILKLTDQKSSS